MAPKLAATAPGSDRLKRQLFIYAAPKQTVRSRPNCGRQPLEEMKNNRQNYQKPPFVPFVGLFSMLMPA